MSTLSERDIMSVSLLNYSHNLGLAFDGGRGEVGGVGVGVGEVAIRSTVEIVTVASLLGVIVVVTVLGNLLVIVTVMTNRKMHNVTNYFLVSLATTDLLLGCVVLPLSVLNTLSPRRRWPFGYVFCNVYVSCDVMLSTVSILTLFAISLDRYFAVTTPLRYRGRMNCRVVWKASAAIWVFSFALAFVPIHFGWNTPDGRVQNRDDPDLCGLSLNVPYVLVVSLGTYFTPLVVMSAVYVRVLLITKKQVKEINRMGRLMIGTPNKERQGKRKRRRFSLPFRQPLDKSRRRQKEEEEEEEEEKKKEDPAPYAQSIVSDRKATVNLASVVLAFAVCWIPYFVLFTVKPLLNIDLTSGPAYHLDLFALWLGYANSSINPFLYAFHNSSFRNGFRRLLCSRRCRSFSSSSSSSSSATFSAQRPGNDQRGM